MAEEGGGSPIPGMSRPARHEVTGSEHVCKPTTTGSSRVCDEAEVTCKQLIDALALELTPHQKSPLRDINILPPFLCHRHLLAAATQTRECEVVHIQRALTRISAGKGTGDLLP
jgi:hypothetical protein